MMQKQFSPVFLAFPSQYSLNCLVISLRLQVSSWDNGLVVHALEAAKNLTSNWIFVHFREPVKSQTLIISYLWNFDVRFGYS